MKKLSLLCLCLCLIVSVGGCSTAKKTGTTNDAILDLGVWIAGDGHYSGNVKEDIVEKAIVEKTGIRFKKENIVYSTSEVGDLQKFNLLYSSDRLPEIFGRTIGGDGEKIMDKLKELNMIYEISDEELKEYAPDIWATVPEIAWKTNKLPNGKNPYVLQELAMADKYVEEKYSDWTHNNMNVVTKWGTSLFFRDDILKEIFPNAKTQKELDDILAKNDKLTWDDVFIPELNTMEGLSKYLYDVKAKHPELTPIFENTPYETTFLGRQVPPWFNQKTMKVESAYLMKEQARSIMKTQNQWYRDKLVEQNFAIIKSDTVRENMARGLYAVVGGGMGTDTEGANKSLIQAGVPYRYRRVIVGYDSDNVKLGNDGYAPMESARAGSGWVINAKKVNKDDIPKILKYLNFFATEEGMKLVSWGPENSGLWEEINGERKWKDPEFEAVVKGEKSKGLMKDYDYYGIAAIQHQFAYKDIYYMPFAYGKLPTLPTVKTNNYNAAFDLALSEKTVKGYYDDTFWAWNGIHPTNENFWSNVTQFDDIRSKILMAKDDAEFDALENKYYDFLKNTCKMDELISLQEKDYINWLKENKDFINFHPDAKLDVLN